MSISPHFARTRQVGSSLHITLQFCVACRINFTYASAAKEGCDLQ